MACLECRPVSHGTTWRVVYYQNGQKQHVKIGRTTRRVALQQKSRVEALLASGVNPKGALDTRKAAAITLSELTWRDSEWYRK